MDLVNNVNNNNNNAKIMQKTWNQNFVDRIIAKSFFKHNRLIVFTYVKKCFIIYLDRYY